MIVLALFWITGNLASRYGEEQAESTEAQLWKQETAVVVDTSERLNAPPQFIRETELDTAEPGFGIRFRYRCFRVLAVKGDRWVPLKRFSMASRRTDFASPSPLKDPVVGVGHRHNRT